MPPFNFNEKTKYVKKYDLTTIRPFDTREKPLIKHQPEKHIFACNAIS